MRSSGLFLFVCAGLLLSGGAILGGSTAWSILRMSYYFWTSDLGVELGASAMFIAGALLCLPACWLATLLPYHAKSLPIVGALMCVLTGAMLLLATGVTTTTALSRALRDPASLNHSMTRSLTHETFDPAVRSSWAAMQLELKCCGVQSYSDWYEYRRALPAACCGRIWNGKRGDQCAVPTHTTGCLRPALAELKGFANSVSALASTMIIVMAVTLFSATYTLVIGTACRNEGRVYKPPQQLRVACLSAHSPASAPRVALASPISPAVIGSSNV